MATVVYRKHRKLADGSYETVHCETSSGIVLRPDGTTVEQGLTNISKSLNNYLPKTGGQLTGGITCDGWCNFEQIRLKNYGNPFECSQYIDFHAVGSDVDYTTRIYADGSGLLRMDPRPDPGAMSLRMSRATTSDPGAGSSLTSGDMIFVYE